MKKLVSPLLLMLGCLMIPIGAVAQQRPAQSTNVPETTAKKLHNELKQGKKILIIDVRSPKEFATGHVPGAVNISIDSLKDELARMKVPKSTTIVTVSDQRDLSSQAVKVLQKLGYTNSSFCTLADWRNAGYGTE